jgi:hypothetical protein
VKRVAAIAVVLLMTGGMAPAQTKADNQLSPTVRLYEPKQVEGASRLARFVSSVVNGVSINWEPVAHALVLRGQPADLDVAEALLKRFDVPDPKPVPVPQVVLTTYLIRAWSAPVSTGLTPNRPLPPTRPVPPELQSSIDEMKRTFPYEHYGVWDVIINNVDPYSGSGLPLAFNPGGRAGESNGLLPGDPDNRPYGYSLSYKNPRMKSAKEVILGGFEFVLKIPFGKDGTDAKIKTDPILHEGQKLVLGKIRLMPSENADLWLIMTATFR